MRGVQWETKEVTGIGGVEREGLTNGQTDRQLDREQAGKLTDRPGRQNDKPGRQADRQTCLLRFTFTAVDVQDD